MRSRPQPNRLALRRSPLSGRSARLALAAGLAAIGAATAGCRSQLDDLFGDIPTTTPRTISKEVIHLDAGACEPLMPTGHVVMRLPDGHVHRIEARDNAAAEDISKKLDAFGRGEDGFIATSPDGAWLLVETGRFECGNESKCMAVVGGSLCSAQVIISEDGTTPVAEATGAIAPGGAQVVFPARGTHGLDLWEVHRVASGWSAPTELTTASPYPFQQYPSFSADGKKLVFDCGPDPGAGTGTAVCEVGVDGLGFAARATPENGPGGLRVSANHHPAFSPDGSIVFEGQWYGAEQVFRLPAGSGPPFLINTAKLDDGTGASKQYFYTDDNSPCVLPDGRIVSLWLGRNDKTGKSAGHEMKIMNGDGSGAKMLLINENVADIGISCSR